MHVEVIRDALVVTPDRQDVQSTPQVLDFFQQRLGLPLRFAQTLLHDGRVHMQGKTPISSSCALQEGRKVWVGGDIVGHPETWLLGADSQLEQPISVLYEDDHILVVDKPDGLIVYPGANETDTLAHRVAAYYIATQQQRRILHVHRLDKPTTGAMLYAKHGYIARALDLALVNHDIGRTYITCVYGQPVAAHGTIDAAIGRDRHVANRFRISVNGKPARTHFRRLTARLVSGGTLSLLECRLETGRTHQIRVHMASLGCPVVGDFLYGSTRTWSSTRTDAIALHAVQVQFVHPYSRIPTMVRAPFPETWFAVLQSEIAVMGAWLQPEE